MDNKPHEESAAGNLLPAAFFNRSTLQVARELLGMRLVRLLDGERLSGRIVECEAYIGEGDLACHARHGRTTRTAVMYGAPGCAYVYFTYGMHWMLNVVTEEPGVPAAVLLRAIEPLEGVETMSARRQGRDTLGPAKLTQAMGIDVHLNGVDLCSRASGLWLESGEPVTDEDVSQSPRVGLFSVQEPWKSMPWRFQVKIR